MDIGLAVGGAFLSSALNVLFDRLAPQGDLLKMFQRDKHDVRLLKKLRITLLGLQAVLYDAENKKASNQYVSQWLNELQDAVDSAENFMEEINYEVLRVKVEGLHQNLAETSNQQVSDLNLCLSDERFLNMKEKLEDTIETLEELEKQIGRLDLKSYLDSSKQETRKPSTSMVDESDIFGRQNEIKELVDRLLSVDANGKNLTVIPIVGMAGVGKTTLAKAVYNNEKLKDHFDLKAWFCVSEPYDASRITKGLLQEIGSFDLKVDNNLNQLQIKLKESKAFPIVQYFPKIIHLAKQVIQLWIANGLVQRLQKDKIIEDSGNQYFLELRSRSLFERVPRSSQGNTEKFLMHDLVNDLAQVASSKLCINLEDNKGSDMLGRCRHLSYSMGYGDFEKLKPLDKLDQLRTLLPINIKLYGALPLSKRVLHNILSRLTSLRALSLSYEIVELPNDLFIKLKLLRFLDLSLTKIKQLPDSICVLYNLETLLLSCCQNLVELPMQMQKLINLHHLDISDTPCLKKPQHLSKLKSICVLLGVEVFLGGSSGSRMEDLGELCSLYGTLSIRQLENVADRREALKANMREKEHIEKLSLEWSEWSESIADSSQNEREILEMLEWKQWHILGNGEEFHVLQNLSIKNCPKLTGKLPENLCSLTKLTISNCPELNLETPIQLSSLKKFKVEGSPKVGVLFDYAELFLSQLQGMKQIVELCISDCHSLTSLPVSILPNTLKEIMIKRCGKLKLEASVGDMIYGGSNMFLEKLELIECDSIDEISPELVPQARYLKVRSCHGLNRILIPNGTEDLGINDELDISCSSSKRDALFHL
ncbi:putative disease resistance rpp13-like protein 1 [Nicotiana attenuata]|uniref:Disease resistance rpp13-like protein 1 n=1 Tax=Nicotiana attenuata TaxID=49451 RepID=A0A314KQ09_NICAT|nr:putative disease resistance rpp13-like protein 1 [Nicotiana attenuata]